MRVNWRIFFCVTILVFLFATNLDAQATPVSLNWESNYHFEKQLYQNYGTVDPLYTAGTKKNQGPRTKRRELEKHTTYKNLHSQVKPFVINELEGVANFDVIHNTSLIRLGLPFQKNASASFSIAPLLEVTWRNDAAVGLAGGLSYSQSFGSKFSINGFYRYVQDSNWDYLDSSVHIGKTLNGIGMTFDSTRNYLHHYEAYASYTPNSYFNFMAGNGKNFWGDGYRSLLLSDNASAYPFLRINSTFWNVKYTNLYAMHNDWQYENYTHKRYKFQVAHQISWNIVKNLNLSVFETIIWQAKDTLNNRNFEPNYLNPIIFFRPVEYTIGSSDNALLGSSLKYVFKEKWVVYGQLLLDEFYLKEIRAKSKWWANKYGIQLGIKGYDLFGIDNLSVLAEYNTVRPFTYAHVTSLQNYGHNDQSLAHPLGSNFSEGIVWLRYQLKNWYFHTKSIYSERGEDAVNGSSNGGNMFRSYTQRNREYGHLIGQGVGMYLFQQEFKVAYTISQAQNLRVFGTIGYRSMRYDGETTKSTLVQIGINSNLWNTYSDH